MSRLDEIRHRLNEARRERYADPDRDEHRAQAWSDFYQHAPSDIQHLLDEIDRLTTRAPRTITTFEELRALPNGTVVVDRDGKPYMKDRIDEPASTDEIAGIQELFPIVVAYIPKDHA